MEDFIFYVLILIGPKVASQYRGSEPFYVHADKHYVEYDPNNPNVMYIGSDGGVAKCTNAQDKVLEFTDANRGYITTQFYGVSFTRDGRIIGGTQDNGSWILDPSQPGTGMEAGRVFGNDGFDSEVSEIAQVVFATSQYGEVQRVNEQRIPTELQAPGVGPFHSVIRFMGIESRQYE